MRIYRALMALTVFLAAHAAGAEDKPRPLLKDFVGLNGHFTFKPELYRQVCGLVRSYHNMDWDVKQLGDKPIFPLCVNKVNWKNDVYGKWAAEGFDIDICAQFSGFGRGNPKYKELWQGKETWAYAYGYDMARYFGPSGSEKLCGSIEIDNEPGNQFDDELYETIFANMARGIRDGDPKIKIATCAVRTRQADAYSKQLKETFSSPAIKNLYDIINVHTYAIKPQREGQSPWERSYPEDPDIDYLKIVDEVIQWRDQSAKDKEIWITEFGWDACTDAVMKDRTGGSKTLNWTGVTDLQQAQYLVRSLLCFAERDIDRAYIYYYNDSDQPTVHAASGLTRNFQPKMSFWAVKHLYDMLGEYRFRQVVKKEENNLDIDEFAHGANENLLVWALWSPTGTNREQRMTIEGLPGAPLKVERMATSESGPEGVEWEPIGARAIRLKVSESPIYVLMDKSPI
ncbi:MAG: hypothetical protein NTW86_09895 [Candidatus Sumerlaeota bacterium]|nr:hypothetical protein [Candidatus Sumerlaeota bacterium]